MNRMHFLRPSLHGKPFPNIKAMKWSAMWLPCGSYGVYAAITGSMCLLQCHVALKLERCLGKQGTATYCIRHIHFASLIFRKSGLQDIFVSDYIRDRGGEQWTQKSVLFIHSLSEGHISYPALNVHCVLYY